MDLFRNRGELAPALLRICAGIAIEHDRAELGSIDLSQVVSTEYRADSVVVLRDLEQRVVGGVIVEIQLRVDRDKERTWPVYVAALRASLGCPVTLLVLTPHDDVGRWARTPIALGHPGFCLVPVVMTFGDLPRITDPATASRLPELAVLSALGHPETEVAAAAIAAISPLPEDRARLYLDIILAALSPSARRALEAHMQGYIYQSEFARRYYSQGLEEGLERGLRSAVCALVRAKLQHLSAEHELAIAALHDEGVLTALIAALAEARTPIEVQAALDHAARTTG